jgi:ATP-dependent RNA helicase HelY
VAGLGFSLDGFQRRALDAIDAGHSVVVAAPTGSGKTVVGEYAVARALAEGAKAFYTTPLKALSNQKYGELVRRHGTDNVGLLTGDNVINATAPVVVMTTEVLRNMIYAASGALVGLRYVVLDEVHYLQNAYRGPVWEEVIIHAPPAVDLVCLSATVSNATELADWIRTVRGDTTAIVETRRPVDLHDLYLQGDRQSERLVLLPTLIDGRPNPAAAALSAKGVRGPGSRGKERGRLYTPRRSDTVELLDDEGMLPAIYFIFSRAACDDAVTQCLREGMRLTSVEERRQIQAIAEVHVAQMDDDDLRLLGYDTWLSGLQAGFAAHHAGLVPPFKEAVEACFAAGLVKVVFATETLSLGINMPARSVVIEKLTKFTGERHEFLTPGEYTQLTGRAGRRGIDDVGYAIVLWSPFVTFDQVATLAGARSYALTSSFRPTYNMAANLVRRYTPEQAHHLLNLSFAQYRSDAEVVHLETSLERALTRLAAAQAAVTCERGDVVEYAALLRASSEAARQRPSRLSEVLTALERVRPGDVLVVPGGKSGGRVAVLSSTRRRGGDIRLKAITPERRVISLGPRDFPAAPHALARVSLPTPYIPGNSGFQKRVASALIAASLEPSNTDPPARDSRRADPPVGDQRGEDWHGADLSAAGERAGDHRAGDRPAGDQMAGDWPSADPADVHRRDVALIDASGGVPTGNRAARRAWRGDVAMAQASMAASHPVAGCPDAAAHLRALERAERAAREVARIQARVKGNNDSLARQFDRVLGVLEGWGYIDGWALTAGGTRLARIYHECDLLIAECVDTGVLDGLRAAELAGLMSVFTFEARGQGTPTRTFPTARVRDRWPAVEALAGQLNQVEHDAGLPLTRSPDPGFVTAAYAWAGGGELGDIIESQEMSGGDFVRNVKQLIDLLRQIGDVAPDPVTAHAAREGADGLFRGVVAAASVVGH